MVFMLQNFRHAKNEACIASLTTLSINPFGPLVHMKIKNAILNNLFLLQQKHKKRFDKKHTVTYKLVKYHKRSKPTEIEKIGSQQNVG